MVRMIRNGRNGNLGKRQLKSLAYIGVVKKKKKKVDLDDQRLVNTPDEDEDYMCLERLQNSDKFFFEKKNRSINFPKHFRIFLFEKKLNISEVFFSKKKVV